MGPWGRSVTGPGAGRSRFGLRVILAAAFGILGLLATLATSLVVARVVDQRLRADIGAEFAAAAERVADLLDRGLFERLRDIQVAASLEAMADAGTTTAERRTVLARLQDTYPDYAILFFVGLDGRIQVSSSGLLTGADVSKREYFRHGAEGPFVADVHDAVLMAPLLNRGPENPPRFVDLAAPVRRADGALAGVITAHLYWEWAEGIERDVMSSLLARHPGAEAVVLSRNGEVLLGPRALRAMPQRDLAPGLEDALAAGRTGSMVVTERSVGDAAPRSHLVGYAATQGHRSYRGLGWKVLVRYDTGAAFEPARRLGREIVVWGALAALLAAGLGWLLAGYISRPLEDLSRAAERLDADSAIQALPAGHGPREIASLSLALSTLVAGMQWRGAALRDGEARLRMATEGAGLGTWEYDVGARRGLRSSLHEAIFGCASVPAGRDSEWSLDDLADRIVDEDRARVLREIEAAIAARAELHVECRIRRADDGEERWIKIRGAPLHGAAAAGAPRYAGVVEDVTDRKQAERALHLIVRELDHRVKNQFAVFDGLVQFTARAAKDPASMALTLRSRVNALAAAHDLVRDAAGEGPTRGLRSTTLRALLHATLAPFAMGAEPGPPGSPALPDRVRMEGPEVEVGPNASSALALVLHELVTNAVRHGALSSVAGRVEVAWTMAPGGAVEISWREDGGPAVRGEPERCGFGTRLIAQSARSQLGGDLRFDWSRPEGLSFAFSVPADRLAR